jgi:hypothetical protein
MPGSDISHHVWSTKYRHRDGVGDERTIAETWRRMATALAAVEPDDAQAVWAERFLGILEDFRFLPGGRIQAGVGTQRNVTLFNCFVMGPIEDSIPGIFSALQEAAVTMQQGGGIGSDFSTQRPQEEAEAIAAVFSRMTATQPLTVEWRTLEAAAFDLGTVVLEHARSADLIIAAQADPDWAFSRLLDFPERLAVESGRPVLVVPYAGRYRQIARNAVIAWKPTREAARAVFDALPLLKSAESVQILEVNQSHDEEGPERLGACRDARAARHQDNLATHGSTRHQRGR